MHSDSIPAHEALRPINPDAVAEVRAAAPDEGLLSLIVQTFQVLGDPTRLRMLYALLQRPLCVRDLAIITGVTESGVSHQLRLLRDRRLVRPQRRGNVIYYAVVDHHLPALIREAEYHGDHLRQGIPDHPYPRP